jgi:hypothetical protein
MCRRRPPPLACALLIAVGAVGCHADPVEREPAAVAKNDVANAETNPAPSNASVAPGAFDALDAGRPAKPRLQVTRRAARSCIAADAGAKGRFRSVARSPVSGKADRVGGSGGLEPDGFKDVVVAVEFEGAALGFLLLSASDSIEAYTALEYDEMHWGKVRHSAVKHVASLIAFENDEPLGDAEHPVNLAPGSHRLMLRVSGYDVTPRTSWRVFAVLPDCSVIEGPSVR